MSQPAFVPERREIWFTRRHERLLRAAREHGRRGPRARRRPGRRRRSVLRGPPALRRRTCACRAARACAASARRWPASGSRARSARGRQVRLTVDLRKMRRVTARLVIRVRLRGGRTVRSTRVYHPCVRTAPSLAGPCTPSTSPGTATPTPTRSPSAIGYAELKRRLDPEQRVRPGPARRGQRADALGARAQRRAGARVPAPRHAARPRRHAARVPGRRPRRAGARGRA